MREIKFRFWDKHNEKFIYCDLFDINKGVLSSVNEEDHIPQQYTGLKDKNEAEIYEGDILGYPESLQDGTLFEVRWARAYSGEQWCEFEIRNRKGQYVPGGKLSDFYGGVHPDYKVVIGNIFEGVDK